MWIIIVILYITIREPNSTYYARATPVGPLIEPPKMLWVTIIFLMKEVSLFKAIQLRCCAQYTNRQDV